MINDFESTMPKYQRQYIIKFLAGFGRFS